MPHIVKRGYEVATERDLYTLALRSADQLTGDLPFGTRRFACLLAWDVAGTPDDVIARVADQLLNAGAVWFTTWGVDCRRVHDVIDQRATETGRNGDDRVIMTTWLAEEPLAEALWDFLHCSLPDETYQEGCGAGLAISIGMPESTVAEIAQALGDLKGWTRRFLDREEHGHAT
jgi:hypothetical protein